jgi:protein-tyrosine-phosphatase
VSGDAPTRRVLIVCHANTSRSIIAEAVLLRLLASSGMAERFEVRSGGIAPYARDGSLVSLDARFVLRDIGIDLPEGAGATDLKRQRHLVERADVILAMTEEQRRMLAKDFPEARGKPVVLLRELAGEAGDIADPSMQSEDVFRHCRDEIVRCLERGLPRLLAEG